MDAAWLVESERGGVVESVRVRRAVGDGWGFLKRDPPLIYGRSKISSARS